MQNIVKPNIQPDTPEHDKLKKVQENSQWLGEFLEFLQQKQYTIAKFDVDEYGNDRLHFIGKSIEQWLSEFFEIDLKKIDAEKGAMLDWIRRKNEVNQNAQVSS